MIMILSLVSTLVHGFFLEPNLCPSGLPFRQKILGDLLTTVFLTSEYHLHLL
jgi:hypothetical protein